MSEIKTSNVLNDIQLAGDKTYAALVESGLPAEEVHRMQVCYEASDLLMANLVEMGHKVRREIHTGEDRMGDQNYVVVENPDGSEIIADPTWQLYVPRENVGPDTPRVLAGTRDEAIAKAREHGVKPEKLRLWEKSSLKMGIDEQKRADQEADKAAARAEEDGTWERFMTATETPTKEKMKWPSRHSRRRVKTDRHH